MKNSPSIQNRLAAMRARYLLPPWRIAVAALRLGLVSDGDKLPAKPVPRQVLPTPRTAEASPKRGFFLEPVLKPQSALDDTAPSRDSGPRFGLKCTAAIAVLLVLAVGAFYPQTQLVQPDTTQALKQASQGSTAAQDGALKTPVLDDLYRLALNVLLVPLLDNDGGQPLWTDAGIDFNCGPETSVTVDGYPLVAGNPVPATAFTVRWNMDFCALMGAASVLSGKAELFVFHDEDGLSAIVTPDRLRVESRTGRDWLRGPFTAEMSLASGPYLAQ